MDDASSTYQHIPVEDFLMILSYISWQDLVDFQNEATVIWRKQITKWKAPYISKANDKMSLIWKSNPFFHLPY